MKVHCDQAEIPQIKSRRIMALVTQLNMQFTDKMSINMILFIAVGMLARMFALYICPSRRIKLQKLIMLGKSNACSRSEQIMMIAIGNIVGVVRISWGKIWGNNIYRVDEF